MSAAERSLPPGAEPYFAARVAGGGVEVEGVHECQLGHRLPPENGGRPDGIFAGWSWDGTRLEVSTDRYGFQPLYYFADDQRVVVSTSVATLLAHGAPRVLDDAALAVFLRLGWFLGDDTPFQAIRAVPPDADFTWRPGALRVAGRLALGKAHGLSRDDTIDAYEVLFRRAIERRVGAPGERVVLPLSGGQDSRHVLLELVRQRRAPDTAVTVRYYPPQRDEEPEAAAVAKRFGIPHVVLSQTCPLFDTTRQAIARQNLCSVEHGWIFPLVDYVRSQCGVMYDGIGGDVLSAGLFLEPDTAALFESGQLTRLAEHLVGGAPGLRMPQRWLARRLNRALAVDRLTRELERHRDAPNPLSSFYFWNRTRRSIAQIGYRLFEAGPVVFSPYLDHAVYDLLAGVPAAMQLDHQLHAATIERAYPEAAGLAYTPKPVHTPGGSPATTTLSRQMLAHAWRRIGSRLVTQRYLLPRLVWCLADRRYAGSAWWFESEALYLWALEEALVTGGTRG